MADPISLPYPGEVQGSQRHTRRPPCIESWFSSTPPLHLPLPNCVIGIWDYSMLLVGIGVEERETPIPTLHTTEFCLLSRAKSVHVYYIHRMCGC